MRRSLLALLTALVAALALAAGPAGAITFGQPDGNLHPNVGALLADWDDESPGPDILCSGTLIAPRVYLTASHCTAFLESQGISQVWVTFASAYDEDSTSLKGLFSGTYHTHPLFASGGADNTFDIATVVLDREPGRTPAQLPQIGLLDSLKKQGTISSKTFTAVGYGTVREDKTTGPHALFFDGVRRYALQTFSSLEKAWITLSQQPSTGDAGTCFGDSGGPHFLGGVDSNLIVSVTVTGDAQCRATDKTYRIDTPWARDFLQQFPGVVYPGLWGHVIGWAAPSRRRPRPCEDRRPDARPHPHGSVCALPRRGLDGARTIDPALLTQAARSRTFVPYRGSEDGPRGCLTGQRLFKRRFSFVRRFLPRAVFATAAACALALAGGATASVPRDAAHVGAEDSASGTHQHGEPGGHLPGSSANVQLIGKLEPTAALGSIVPGQIADLAVYKDFAYLNSWSEPTCTKGGVYVVDIRNPRKPKEAGFIPALPGNYHGEGAHVVSVSTKTFTGDLLAVNNERCAETDAGGGFDLYDVTDPSNPKTLIQGGGDHGGEGQMNGNEPSNDYHSVFMWMDDGKVYLVGTDNEEFHDVDIFDITNPRAPKPVQEYDLLESFPQISQAATFPRLSEIFNHDMVVKVVDGRDVLLDSYWDAGYVMVDVENPAKAAYIGDTDFENEDPLVPGISPPEGNAHEAEFSHDNTYFLGADEDFNPYRSDKFFIGDQERPAVEVGGGTSPASLPDQTLSGKVVYGGYGCPADPTVVPLASDYTAEELGLQAGDEKILLMQRGPSGDPSADYNGNGDLTDDACFPGEKAAKAFDAGWDALVLVNRHLGSDDSTSVPFCGSGAYDPAKPMVTVCTTHAGYHELFGTTPEFTTPYSATDAPAIGAISVQRVKATSIFDSWGYLSLYRRGAGKVERIDSYAIPEALDPAFAFGFGDLSIHEVATDPGQNIAYSSYYAGGVRVFGFGASGIQELGHYIDAGGNNFWGVETFVPGTRAAGGLQGKRLFAGSDRDFGIFIFRYTGG